MHIIFIPECLIQVAYGLNYVRSIKNRKLLYIYLTFISMFLIYIHTHLFKHVTFLSNTSTIMKDKFTFMFIILTTIRQYI